MSRRRFLSILVAFALLMAMLALTGVGRCCRLHRRQEEARTEKQERQLRGRHEGRSGGRTRGEGQARRGSKAKSSTSRPQVAATTRPSRRSMPRRRQGQRLHQRAERLLGDHLPRRGGAAGRAQGRALGSSRRDASAHHRLDPEVPRPHRRRRGVGDRASPAQGVVVGVIDTGIWPEHPSFADDGSYCTPSNLPLDGTTFPTCDFGNTGHHPDDAPFTCNNKLIGARQVMPTYRALDRRGPGRIRLGARRRWAWNPYRVDGGRERRRGSQHLRPGARHDLRHRPACAHHRLQGPRQPGRFRIRPGSRDRPGRRGRRRRDQLLRRRRPQPDRRRRHRVPVRGRRRCLRRHLGREQRVRGRPRSAVRRRCRG